jgi:serine phosphatase RsbU (regulator of sigma subunit)
VSPAADPRSGAPPRAPTGEEAQLGGGGRWPYGLALAVLVLGVLITGVLVWVSQTQYLDNETHLLRLRARELGLVLADSVPNVQTPLASAAALADATDGNVQKFTRFVTPEVGPGRQFLSVSLWRLASPQQGPLSVVGRAPALGSSPTAARTFFAAAMRRGKLNVIALGAPVVVRLGYVFSSAQLTGRFAVYGEVAVPANRRSRLQSNAAFSELNYVVYLGRDEQARRLLVTDVAKPPIRGRQATEVIPFGDSSLTLVVAPRVPLAGTLPERLPWIILVAGLLLSLGASVLTARLIQRQRAAVALAGRLESALEENRELYAQQRTIARTLQHALLPDRLPEIAGAQAYARYEPGERGVEIGGDWYDVIALAEGRVMLIVGDVSGRGLSAGTTMASLRYGIHAYAVQEDSPATILSKLSRLLSVSASRQLATVLCALIDVSGRTITLASAGHLPPLLLEGGGARYLEVIPGVPIGVEPDSTYPSTTVSVAPEATLLAFTDGLVERRGEAIDTGLERLRRYAAGRPGGLPELMAQLLGELRPGPAEDDTAIVGLRWTQ